MNKLLRKGFAAIEAAMERACAEEGVTPLPALSQKRSWSRSPSGGELRWVHPLFGTLTVQSRNCAIDRRGGFTPSCSWAAVFFDDQPTSLNFVFNVNPVEEQGVDIQILHLERSEKGEVRMSPVITNPVIGFQANLKWNNDRADARLPENCRSFVFLRSDGMFVQLQVCVKIYGFRCWLVIQEIYNGQPARTNRNIAEDLPCSTVPMGLHSVLVTPFDETNAYRGSDYFKSFPGASDVVKYAVARGAVVPFSRCRLAKWKPEEKDIPDSERENGWETADVLWCDQESGWGNVECEDGAWCAVNLSRLVDKDGDFIWTKGTLPVLEPMTKVAIKHEPNPTRKGGRRATFIRSL